MKFRWPITFGEERGSPENPSTSLSKPGAWLINLMGGGPSTSGVAVTIDAALGVPAVWRSVNLIADTIASLPLNVYRGEENNREVMQRSPLNTMLSKRPNPGLTSFRWRRLYMRHLLTHGRHYSRIERNNAGRPIALFPLNPTRVAVERKRGELFYTVQLEQGGKEVLPAEEVLHFTGLDDEDGLDGIPVVERAKNAIGLAVALETFGASFFKNGARPGLVLEYPNRLSKEGVQQLKASVQETHGQVGDSHKVMVMEDGAKVHKVTNNPEESQFTESRELQRKEIANIFNVPLFFLGDSDPAKANSEQQALFFVKHSIRPWLNMTTQEMDLKLLTPGQAQSQSILYNTDSILRGDIKGLMEALSQGVQNSIFRPNEARDRLDLPADPEGNRLMIQQNMSPLGALPNQLSLDLENDDEG